MIAALWIVESILKHDRTGFILAVSLGFIFAPAIGYF